ncbi:MAG: HAD hydrolase-like protein [Phycisphaera sp.]|nr:HAD hydrolase-like protein [Phycisphaera sp.]
MIPRMKRVLLLFDIDGTLLLTKGAGVRSMQLAAKDLFGPDWQWGNVPTAGHLDPHIFARAAAVNALADAHQHHERFRDRYIELLAHELHTTPGTAYALPGVIEIVDTLYERATHKGDIVLGMLTGNYTAAVPVKLTAVGLDPRKFSLTALGDEGPTRESLVELAMKKYHIAFGQPIPPTHVIVIGDTQRDIDCAKAHGCVAFTVATGPVGVDDLLAGGADYAVRDLADPAPLLGLVEKLLA